MQKLAPRLSAIVWSLWVLHSLYLTFVYSAPASSSLQSSLQTIIGFGAKGAGITLSLLLCQRPQRSWAFLLAGVCLFVLWKFYVASILVRMLPALGGLSFGDSASDWWHNTTSSPVRFISVPFGVFALLSLVFWPAYGLALGRSQGLGAPGIREV